jgi:aminodeoxyfutalosine synthase
MPFSTSIDFSGLIAGRFTHEGIGLVAEKVMKGLRITPDEALLLYEHADLSLLAMLSSFVSNKINGNSVYFNRNFHIEPTNICVYSCTFCSYRRAPEEDGSWEMNLDDIRKTVRNFRGKGVTEVHITGGVHPRWNIEYFGQIISAIKSEMPSIHVKAFSAIELDYIISKAKLSAREGIRKLKGYGLDSIPGGGAEIADPEVREKICGEKTSWHRWLEIHEAAHLEGLTSNATMLYGHIESYKHRVNHMESLRRLQDRTKGFNCFIPLKFKASNNKLQYIGEVSLVDDLRNFAVSRIFFDNIKHLKAYWPMLGKQATQLALAFGVDDIDGTIDDSTKIYSMAGAEDQNPSMTIDGLCGIIRSMGKTPVERDSVYNAIRNY